MSDNPTSGTHGRDKPGEPDAARWDADWEPAATEPAHAERPAPPARRQTRNGGGGGARKNGRRAGKPAGDRRGDGEPGDDGPDGGSEGEEALRQEPMFTSLTAWITEWLAPTITVEPGPQMRWCPQWWRHAEAVSKLESIWRAWEDHRISPDPNAMSLWWRDHGDYHLGYLMESNRTPFRQCSPNGHRDDLTPLPIEPPPPGWFGEPAA